MARSNARHELFSRWLTEHRERMLRVARPYAGGAIEAEDIVQMAAVIAWRRLETLREEASVGPWLLRITSNMGRNVAEMRARRTQLRTEHSGRRPESHDPFTPGIDDDPRRDWVLVAAESLPPAQREAVLCLLAGMSNEEMAAELRKTVQAVHALRHRALRSLEGVLTPPRMRNPDLARVNRRPPGHGICPPADRRTPRLRLVA